MITKKPNEISSHMCLKSNLGQKKKKRERERAIPSFGEDVEKREPVCTIDGNV